MKCGSKCFLVEIEVNGERQTKKIRERSAIRARKAVRSELGSEAIILSAIEEKKHR